MKTFCIIGLGRFGQTLAVTLAKNGHQVMVIDENNEVVNSLSDLVTNSIVGDPTNEAVLRASGVKNYDCVVVALSRNINDSILITLILKDLGVPKVVVRATSELHKRVLEKIGADEIVFPEQDMGEKVAYMLDKNNVLEYIEFSNDYSIVEVKTPTKWVGKSIIDIDVRKKYGVTIIALSNTETGRMDISPSPDRRFESCEIVALMGSNIDIDKITKNI